MGPNDTLNEALRLIDPDGTLVPGTRQHDRIREMVEIWLRRHSPEEVLEMARNRAKYLNVWWKVLWGESSNPARGRTAPPVLIPSVFLFFVTFSL